MANALVDLLQSASNSAADTVGAPVDALAWLLRKAGVPVPDNPMLGTKWQEQAGLRRPVAQGAAQVAGETLGLLAPTVAAAKAPQIAAGLLQAQRNAAMPRTMRPDAGAIVWHGSPHKFDRFDASKIGSGEGSQAYGHGLYLAEEPTVARSYSALAQKPGLTQQSTTGVGRDFKVIDSLIRLNANKYTGGDVEKLAELIRTRPGAFAKPDELLARIPEYVGNQPPGFMYKVDLPDNVIARMLDWDKPLSQQAPNVQAMLSQGSYGFGKTERVGPMAVKTMFVDRMRSAGVPGIRYLDGGSRGAGAGTSNFVVFPGEEEVLRILERNGVPLPR